MDEKQEPAAVPAQAQGKAEWTRPDVDRFAAGGAEGSADISTDGIDIPS